MKRPSNEVIDFIILLGRAPSVPRETFSELVHLMAGGAHLLQLVWHATVNDVDLIELLE